jgi:hypothetical protein
LLLKCSFSSKIFSRLLATEHACGGISAGKGDERAEEVESRDGERATLVFSSERKSRDAERSKLENRMESLLESFFLPPK